MNISIGQNCLNNKKNAVDYIAPPPQEGSEKKFQTIRIYFLSVKTDQQNQIIKPGSQISKKHKNAIIFAQLFKETLNLRTKLLQFRDRLGMLFVFD